MEVAIGLYDIAAVS